MERLSFEEAERVLRDLGPVPKGPEQDWLTTLKGVSSGLFSVEAGVGIEATLTAFALDRHATTELERAFGGQYPRLAETIDLETHYERLLDKGTESAEGFIRALRGKLFEERLPDLLSERFPGFDFKIAKDATQKGWDLVGSDDSGAEIFIQAKARAASAASDVVGMMEEADAPEWFAVTEDLHSAIVDSHPELADRLVEIDVSSMELNEEAESALATLSEQMDLDVPDSLTDMLPYVGEIVLGIRLIVDLVRNEQTLAGMPRGDKNRLHAVRVLTLMARFGVSTVMASAGGAGGAAAGSVFPGAGTAIGGVVGTIGGAISAGYINRTLEPRILSIGLDLAGVSKDDLFYFQNKEPIDQLGKRLAEQSAEAEAICGL